MRIHDIPSGHPSPIQTYLEQVHREFAGLNTGKVASYIPELAKADPSGFAIAIATADGQVYEVGDAQHTFSIQSVSKPFVYGLALEDAGREKVERTVGTEPTGDAFNSISLEPETGRPRNPMINAGAIAASSLIAGHTAEERLARVVGALSAFAGRALGLDPAVYESERSTGHRNRAIGHMLRNYDIIASDPEPALELYFQQCAVSVNCRDLALMAATLANGGQNPVTGVQALKREWVEPVLSLMTTCGMYNFSGSWAYRVGLPAKSGVGGGIIAVLPGQLGIGVYSPVLDELGNSERGVQVCQKLSADWGLHFLQPPRPLQSAIRSRYNLAGMRSKRRRTPAESTVLDAQGARALVFELQGDLRFATLEPVSRAVVEAGDSVDLIVLDFRRVDHVDLGATRLLAGLASRGQAMNQHLVLSRVRRGDLLAGLDGELAPRAASHVHFVPQLDAALEWCEHRLLKERATPTVSVPEGDLSQHSLCAGLSAADVDTLHAYLQRHDHQAGDVLVRRGDPASAIYLITAGEVSVLADLPDGARHRLATLQLGMSFGESALVEGGLRSADVRADTNVTCWSLSTENFTRLKAANPALALTLLHNLLRSARETILRLTREVAVQDTA